MQIDAQLALLTELLARDQDLLDEAVRQQDREQLQQDGTCTAPELNVLTQSASSLSLGF